MLLLGVFCLFWLHLRDWSVCVSAASLKSPLSIVVVVYFSNMAVNPLTLLSQLYLYRKPCGTQVCEPVTDGIIPNLN